MKTIRLFDDAGVQTKIASDTGNEMTVACMDILTQLEGQLDELVDLRDLHFILTAAVGTFICDVVIKRRLGRGDESPDEIKREYPRLGNGGEAFGRTKKRVPEPYLLVPGNVLVEGGIQWDCELSPTKHCLYDDDEDPMGDECVHCGNPYERK